MKIFELVANAVVLLTITVFMLSVFAVITRWLANGREARVQRLRAGMLDSIQRFLSGEITMNGVATSLQQDRNVALGALVSSAPGISRERYPRLRLLIEHLHLNDLELASLRHRNWTKRAHAATRLGILRYQSAVPELVHALNDVMLDVRLAAAHALSQMKATHTIEPILRSLALPVGWPLQRCTEILYEMGPAAIDPLLAVQREERLPSAAASVVVKVLGMLGAVAAVPALVTYLKHPNDEIRLASAKSLGQIGSGEAAKPLCSVLNDPVWPVRSAAAKSLGQLRDRTAIPALASKLADGAWWVRFNAAEAIYCLKGIEELNAAMTGHADRFARDISRQILEEHGAATAFKASAS